MIKFFSLYIVILLLAGAERGYTQDSRDTLVSPDSLITDSSGSGLVENTEANYDSLYQPVPDNDFLSKEPLRQVPQDKVDAFLRNPDYAYANDPAYWQKESPQNPGVVFRFLLSPVFRWTLLLLITGLVGYGIFQLARENNFSWLARKPKLNPVGKEEPLPEEEIDIEKAILACQAEENFRMAVRFLYLRLIHTAREKSGIRFRDSSTNAEIMRAFGSHPKAAEFRWLATAYEYIFYGGFLPGPDLYDELKNKFDAFQKILSV